MAGSDTRTLKVVIVGNAKSAEAALGRLQAEGAKTEATFAKVGHGIKKGLEYGSLAMVATAGVSLDLAAKFQRSMTLIQTQAGGSAEEVKQLSKQVLGLAGQVGTAPEELSKGLYHLVSTGMSAQKAMQALRIAAEGAQVGQANLEDVTNALNATIASGIPGAQNMQEAMGALNATVGAGDMRMQDLADAMGTGVLATVKGFGLSLNDVSAALATFGDNNIRGADAATQLRMAVLFMAKPAKTAKDALKTLGMTSKTLADDMASGGLTKALTDLHDRLDKAGIKGAKVGQILVDAFGHKAGTGLSILVGQFARYMTKTKEVEAGAKGFGDAWKATTHTAAFQWDKLKSSVSALAITIGTVLMPPLTKVFGYLTSGASSAIGGLSTLKDAINTLFHGDSNSKEGNGLLGRFAGKEQVSTADSGIQKLAKSLHDSITKALHDGVKGIDIGKVLGNSIATVANFFVKLIGKLLDAAAGVDWIGVGIKIGKFAVPMLLGLATGLLNFDLGGLLKGIAKHWKDILFALLGLALLPEKWAIKIAELLAKIPFAGKIMSWLFKVTTDLAGKIFDPVFKLLGFLGKAFVDGFRGEGPKVFQAIARFFTDIGTWLFVHGHDFYKWGKKLLENLVLGMASLLEHVGAFLGKLASYIVRGGVRLVDLLTKPGRQLMGKFFDAVVSAGHRVAGWFEGMGSWILRHVGNLSHTLWDAGVKLIEGFIGGIGHMFGSVKNKLGDLTSKLTSWKGPPSRDKNLLFQNGQLVIDGFTRGLESRYDNVKKSLGGFTNGLSGIASGSLSVGGISAASRPSSALALASAGGGVAGAGQAPIHVEVNVKGSVMSEKDLVSTVTEGVRKAMRARGVTPTI